MFERFTDRARKIMAISNQEAQRFSHRYIGTEHILLGLVKEGSGVGAAALKQMGFDLRQVRLEVEKRIAAAPELVLIGKLPQMPQAKAVIEYAIKEARALDHRYVGSEHLLLGLVRDQGLAGQVLGSLGVTIELARQSVLELLRSGSDDQPQPGADSSHPRRGLGRLLGSSSPPPAGNLTDRLRTVMSLSSREAQRLNHEYIGTEHLLLGLVKEGSGVGANVLKNLDIDLRKVRLEVEKLVKAGPDMVSMGKLPQTPRAKKAIEYAIEEATSLNHNYTGTEHLLLGLLREHDGVATQALRNLGLSLEIVREEITKLLGSTGAEEQRTLVDGCPLCDRLRAISTGAEPSLIAELAATHALLGDNQGSRGWCVLIVKDHHEHLTDLDPVHQHQVWTDVSRVATAIRSIFPSSGKDGLPPRINYECLGNLVPHIHWHIIPRHADDPEPSKPVWGWPEPQLRGTMSRPDRANLIAQLRQALSRHVSDP